MGKQKLIFRLLLFVLPLLVLSIILTSVILSWTSYTYFLKTVRQDYDNIIRSSARAIQLYMDNSQKNLETLALAIAATKSDAWQKEMALTAFSQTASQFISVTLISSTGETVASGDYETNDVKAIQAIQSSRIFQKALRGERAISNVLFTEKALPYIQMAVPVSHLGQVTEVVWGELGLKSVWDVLKDIHFGKTGQVFIADRSGRLVGHEEIDRVVKDVPSEREGAVEKIVNSSEPVEWIESNADQKIFRLGYLVPGLDWIVVLSQTYSEIYRHLYFNFFWASIITCIFCLVAIVIGWNRVKQFLKPIYSLHHQVQRIGRGDLNQQLSVEGKDEIGDLARAFNEMTRSLRAFIQREVETAKELVHAKNLAVLGTTSSKVTHEVGNLLNNVGLIIPLLKQEKLTARGEKAVQMLEKDAVRTEDFIRRFLQFAKKPELQLRQVSLDGLVREVLFVHEEEAKKRGIQLELDWPADLPATHIDSKFMYQALRNLVNNSMDAMSDSGHIYIQGRKDENHLRITVEDTGHGMDPETLEQIFDPFFTKKGKKGTGLGLPIVKTIVEAHRGTIVCRSIPGRGTTFELALPLH